jgi:hypothetical protein
MGKVEIYALTLMLMLMLAVVYCVLCFMSWVKVWVRAREAHS